MEYNDIIDLPHHVSKRHRPMSLLARAAQFAPFAALTGYDDAIHETARLTDSQQQLADDEQQRLDLHLPSLKQSLAVAGSTAPTVTLTHFVPDIHKDGGRYVTESVKVKRLVEMPVALLLTDGRTVPLSNIVDMALQNADPEL